MDKITRFPIVFIVVVLAHIVAVYNFGFSQKEQAAQIAPPKKQSVVIELTKTTQQKALPTPPKAKKRVVENKMPIEKPQTEDIEEIETLSEQVVFDELPADTEYATNSDIQKTAKVEIPKPALSADSLAIIKAAYLEKLKKKLNENKNYPPAAKRRGLEGVVHLKFKIMADGTIINETVSQKSQFAILDRSALETVKNITKHKPIPKELEMESMELEVPFFFILK